MSFASDVKKELTGLEVHREHAKAELAALIRMNGSLSLVNQQFVLNVQTEKDVYKRQSYFFLFFSKKSALSVPIFTPTFLPFKSSYDLILSLPFLTAI